MATKQAERLVPGDRISEVVDGRPRGVWVRSVRVDGDLVKVGWDAIGGTVIDSTTFYRGERVQTVVARG